MAPEIGSTASGLPLRRRNMKKQVSRNKRQGRRETMLPMRELGRSGIKIPPVVLGGNVFGWTADTAASFRVLDAALERGLKAIDTADVYSRWLPGHTGGESEAIIGVWLKERQNRDKVIIATKVGLDMGNGKEGLSRARIFQAVDESLIRLQTDYIDLYQAHRDKPATKLEETLGAFNDLIKAGKIRAIGASNYTAKRLAEALSVSKAHGLARFESLQPLYNLMERKEYEGALQDLCVAEGIGVINYYALAAGFLTGKYRKLEDAAGARGGTVRAYCNETGWDVLAALDKHAARLGGTPAQLALAWVLAQPGIAAPIASATKVEQLDDLVKAATLKLDAAALADLDVASA
jgi:aryl-alcohol dehydrogenase-like predicted oxidoreductase